MINYEFVLLTIFQPESERAHDNVSMYVYTLPTYDHEQPQSLIYGAIQQSTLMSCTMSLCLMKITLGVDLVKCTFIARSSTRARKTKIK